MWVACGRAVLLTLHQDKIIDDDTNREHLERVHRMEHEQATLGDKSAHQERLAERLALQQQI